MGIGSEVFDAGAAYHGGAIFQFIGSVGLDVRDGWAGLMDFIMK